MKDILPELDRWQSQGEEIALATVVRVQRSAPRPPGARMLVTRSGRIAGSVSGGCVESDVLQQAMQVLDTGQAALVHYGIPDEMGFQVGLSCGGAIDVLLEPLVSSPEWMALRHAVEHQLPAVCATVLAPPSLLGRRLVLVACEQPAGSISFAIDAHVVKESGYLLQTGGTRLATVPWEEGEAQVFLEAFLPQPQLLIVGATHTAIALSRLAGEVGYRVTVVDARSALATLERFPGVHQLVHGWPEEVLPQIPLDSLSSVVVLTHDPKFDIPALACALRSPARYIGALGSRATHEERKKQLRQQGFSYAELERIRAPVGLDIGARTPEELAVAILAEILAVWYGRA